MKFKHIFSLILGSLLMLLMLTSSYAGQDEFNAGFEGGIMQLRGDLVIVSIPPIAPITPIGSTDFREGIKVGMRAAGQ